MPPNAADKVGKFIEIARPLAEALKAYADSQGTTFTFEVEDALRRHLAFPPERKPEPLPDSPAVTPAAKKGGRAKKGG